MATYKSSHNDGELSILSQIWDDYIHNNQILIKIMLILASLLCTKNMLYGAEVRNESDYLSDLLDRSKGQMIFIT